MVVTATSIAQMLALVGGVIAVAALFSGIGERRSFPQVLLFLAIGLALGPSGIGVMQVDAQSPLLRIVATLGLALVLFTDALALNISDLKAYWRLAFAILGPGTLLALAIITLSAIQVLQLPLPLALLLAAPLASTDPVLLRTILRRPHLPPAARVSLRLESALNDVVLLPVIVAAMLFVEVGNQAMGKLPEVALNTVVISPALGALVSFVAVRVLVAVRDQYGIRRDYESLYSLGVCFAAFAAGELVHGSGYLAAFAAGLVIAIQDVELCDCFQEYGETTAELLLLFTFVLLGASIMWSGLALATPAVVLFVILALAARWLSLHGVLWVARLGKRARRLVAGSGPRGLSTLLLALIPVFEAVPGSEGLLAISTLVVLVSIGFHGLTLARWDLHLSERTSDSPPISTGESVPAAQIKEWIAEGKPVVLVDVRSAKAYEASRATLRGALRLNPERPAYSAGQLGIEKDAWPALFCT
jgi:NhaP-type Na+/H+ or K+/H+ antiporter